MEIKEMVSWIENWCTAEGLKLVLDGLCGFGRECVGVTSLNGETYPDYKWYDKNYDRIDNNGDVWCPPNAYHKHPCVAVLGNDDMAIKELYEWCKWFYENGFHYKKVSVECNDKILLFLGRDNHHQMKKDGI